MDEWVDRFLKREIASAGNKGEYYTLQPRDYVHINRSASKIVRMLLESDLNLICVCQVKDKWEDMKVVGSIFDGWKRLPYYFDTIIEISEDKKNGGWKAFLKGKDRSGSLVPGQPIPWENDEEIVEYLAGKFGTKLDGSPIEQKEVKKTAKTEKQAAKKVKAKDAKAEPKTKKTESKEKTKAKGKSEPEHTETDETKTVDKTETDEK